MDRGDPIQCGDPMGCVELMSCDDPIGCGDALGCAMAIPWFVTARWHAAMQSVTRFGDAMGCGEIPWALATTSAETTPLYVAMPLAVGATLLAWCRAWKAGRGRNHPEKSSTLVGDGDSMRTTSSSSSSASQKPSRTGPSGDGGRRPAPTGGRAGSGRGPGCLGAAGAGTGPNGGGGTQVPVDAGRPRARASPASSVDGSPSSLSSSSALSSNLHRAKIALLERGGKAQIHIVCWACACYMHLEVMRTPCPVVCHTAPHMHGGARAAWRTLLMGPAQVWQPRGAASPCRGPHCFRGLAVGDGERAAAAAHHHRMLAAQEEVQVMAQAGIRMFVANAEFAHGCEAAPRPVSDFMACGKCMAGTAPCLAATHGMWRHHGLRRFHGLRKAQLAVAASWPAATAWPEAAPWPGAMPWNAGTPPPGATRWPAKSMPCNNRMARRSHGLRCRWIFLENPPDEGNFTQDPYPAPPILKWGERKGSLPLLG